jgi:hypothetical protein
MVGPGLGCPLLTGGYCSEVVVNTGLTVLTGAYKVFQKISEGQIIKDSTNFTGCLVTTTKVIYNRSSLM